MASSTRVTRERVVDGPSSATTTTTYTSKSSSEHEVTNPRFKALMTPRSTIIHRTSYGGPGSIQTTTVHSQQRQSYGMPSGHAATTAVGVNQAKTSRDKEKRDMQDLNERLASYIEKVRFLEAQNRKLADELDKLKSKWGKETTHIKAMFEVELEEARKLIEECEKDKAKLEDRVAKLEDQLEDLRRKLDEALQNVAADRERLQRQDQQLSEYEAEVNLLRRRVASMEADRDKDKKEIARLQEALNRARIDLDNETINHIDAENRRQTLEEELEFLKGVHEQELKELAALAYRDTTQENREFWKSEMGSALRDIQREYDDKLDAMRNEMDNYYTMKIQEFKTGATKQNMEIMHSKEESKKLRTQLTDIQRKINDLEARNSMLEKEIENLRREYEEKEREWEAENNELKSEVAKLKAEMEAILKELQDLLDTKLGLELEIAAYRKLLEGEESRLGLRGVIDSMIRPDGH